MRTLATLALSLLLTSCDSHPLGIKEGDGIQSVTLKSGQRLPFSSTASVSKIDGKLVTVFSYGKEQTIDFAEVAAWERR